MSDSCDLMDCNPPGSSVHGIFQARILDWIAIYESNPGLRHCKQILYQLSYDGSDGKASVCNARDPGSSPGLGRSPGEGNGNPLQYYCLENPKDRGAWQAAVYQSMGSQRVGHD